MPEEVPIRGWTIVPDGTGPARKLERLLSWTEIDGMQYYSGCVAYEASFSLEEAHLGPGIGLELDLGDVREVATVLINGTKAGDLWMPPYAIDIQKLVRTGVNSIKVEVTNLLINKILGLPNADHGDVHRTYGKRFPDPREKQECHPQPSGLLGPVMIKTYRLVEIP
jgi:hypothetical protein